MPKRPDARYPDPVKPSGEGSKVQKNQPDQGPGLPLWAIMLSGGIILALLVYNVLRFGPEGYPTTVVLGGLFGTVFGVNEYLKNRGGGK